jgi:hypothetical protein
VVLGQAGQAEVGNLEAPRSIEQQVLGLQVAVAHAALVAVRHAVHQLLEVHAR